MTDADLQLLPERRKSIEIHTPGQNKPLVFSIILAVIVGAVYGALYFYKSSLLSTAQSIDNELAALEQRRDKPTEEKLLLLNKKLAVVGPLLSGHVYWSEAFARIQRLTQPQVQFKTLSAGTSDKKLIFKANAPNYMTVARQIAAFLSDGSIADITLDKVATLPSNKVEFNMSMIFDPKTFLAKPK